jgi:hypothetical protein
LQSRQYELIVLPQSLDFAIEFLPSVGEFADLAVELLVGVKLDLVFDLHHHRLDFLELIADIGQVFLLLQLQSHQVMRRLGHLQAVLELAVQVPAVLLEPFCELLGGGDGRLRLLAGWLFRHLVREGLLQEVLPTSLTHVRIGILDLLIGNRLLEPVLLHGLADLLHYRHEPLAQPSVIFD